MSEDKLILAGHLVLEHELDVQYRDYFRSWEPPPWGGAPDLQQVVDNDRMPTWAIGLYDICLYWEDTFHTEKEIRMQGNDRLWQRDGVASAWILMNKDLEFHILEASMRWIELEDGIEVESDSRVLIDAWQQPTEH